MAREFRVGDCVKLPDGRVGRIRGRRAGEYRVRVRRTTSKTHQFVFLAGSKLKGIACPDGWMSPEGYRRYLKPVLANMRRRRAESR